MCAVLLPEILLLLVYLDVWEFTSRLLMLTKKKLLVLIFEPLGLILYLSTSFVDLDVNPILLITNTDVPCTCRIVVTNSVDVTRK